MAQAALRRQQVGAPALICGLPDPQKGGNVGAKAPCDARPARKPTGSSPLQARGGRASALRVEAVAAVEKPSMAPEYIKSPGEGVGIYQGTDGYLYCDGLRVDDIRAQTAASPFYLYSQQKIRHGTHGCWGALSEHPAFDAAAPLLGPSGIPERPPIGCHSDPCLPA